MSFNEITQAEVEETLKFLDTATGHVGETARTFLSLLKQWGFSYSQPHFANEILLTRLGLQRAEIFKSLQVPHMRKLLIRPASENIAEFILNPIQTKRDLHFREYQYDTVDFNKELPLYLFMLMLIERAEKRKQLLSNKTAIVVSIKLIYEIIEREFPNFSGFSKLNGSNALTYGMLVFVTIIEKIGLNEGDV